MVLSMQRVYRIHSALVRRWDQGAIALRRVRERCPFEIIADQIYGVIAEFALSGKVSHCVTDSDANFNKAFQLSSVANWLYDIFSMILGLSLTCETWRHVCHTKW